MANIAIFRINYKSDFILTLNSDAGWTTPFCIKFWTGAPSQAYFVGYDGETYTHCAPVAGDPTKLAVQFDDHHLPIGDLKFQIGYHFTVADFPTSVEDEVINQASVIIEVDNAPAQVMLDLNGETAPEIQFSLPAYANEAQRIANEEQRIAAEAIRIVNEESRIAAETIRQQNEAHRIAQETARVNEFATLKSQSQAATSAANTAAALANEKASLAADKATLADAAATLANEKAQLAADKAALAQASATLANDKAALAQQKAAYAQTQGDYAKTQGDYAKEQGDTAQADHERAESDHTRAESDHATAGSDHTQAGTDHLTAANDHAQSVTDHNQADTDHTRAESDHAQATSDHTQAGTDHTRAESDHATASADHTQAGQDHTRAESDHTRAESDHAAVEVYVDSLGAFDISAYNATGGVLAKYADLAAALGTNGANIPDALRKGGMSVKFVLTSDNKYVRYNYLLEDATTNSKFTNVANWQGVDDNLTADSNNLAKSGSVFEKVHNISGYERNAVFDFSTGGTSQWANRRQSYTFKKGYVYRIEVLTSDSVSQTYFSVRDSGGNAINGMNGICRGKGSRHTDFVCSADGGVYLYMTLQDAGNPIVYNVVITNLTDLFAYSIAVNNKEYLNLFGVTPYDVVWDGGDGYIGYDDGLFHSATTWRVSSPISLNQGDVIFVNTKGSGTRASVISIVNDGVYTPKTLIVIGQKTFYYQAESSCNVVLSKWIGTGSITTEVYMAAVGSTLSQMIKKLERNDSIYYYPMYGWMFRNGTIYEGNFSRGIPNTATTLSCTTYFYIGKKETETLYFKCKNRTDGNTLNIRINFYDESRTYISQQGYSVLTSVAVPANTAYFRVSLLLKDGNGNEVPLNREDIAYNELMISHNVSHDYELDHRYGNEKTDIIDLNNDYVFINKLTQLKWKYRYGTIIGSDVLVLAHFSDLHGSDYNLGRIIYWVEHNNSYIDDMIHTGDCVHDKFTDGVDFWTGIKDSENVLQITGNHDYHTTGSEPITQSQVYNMMFKDNISNWEVTSAGEGLCYWYKDYASCKIRLIGVDCMRFDASQQTWLETVLSGAKTAGYSVVIATHTSPGAITSVKCAFNTSHLSPDTGINYWGTEMIAIVQDFIDNGGEFVCYMGGHTHRDIFGYLTSNPQQTVYLVDTARLDNYWTDHQSNVESKSADLFNVVGFDTTAKTISILRVGNDCDKYMRHIGQMCWNYQNMELLSSW